MAFSKRGLLVLANLGLLFFPSLASAGNAGHAVGRVAAGCCGHVASAAVGGIVSSAVKGGGRNRSSRPSSAASAERPSFEERCFHEHDARACEERCFIEDDADACLAEAHRISTDGQPDAHHRALAYLDRACALTRDATLCDRAEAIASALNPASTPDPAVN